MGYTTTFKGKFKLDRPLTGAHRAYLEASSVLAACVGRRAW